MSSTGVPALIRSKDSVSAAIVLSDFRFDFLLAAIDIYATGSRSQLFVSGASLARGDFGDYVNEVERREILDLLAKRFRVKICELPVEDDVPVDFIACMSSLVSITNDSRATPARYPEIWRQCLGLERGSQAVRAEIKNGEYDRCYVFNGRTASTRAIARGSNEKGYPMPWVFEAGSLPGSYRVFRSPLHDRVQRGTELLAWSEKIRFRHSKRFARKSISAKLGNQFESSASEKSGVSFPTVVFPGSPHEYLWWDGPESAGLDSDPVRLVEEARAQNPGRGKIGVRLHPNMACDPSHDKILEELRANFSSDEVEVISATSKQSSHDLIRRASVVVVAGSSISLDALYLGKKVVLLEKNEFSQIIEISSLKFPDSGTAAKNVAGLVREFGRRSSKIPSLRIMAFLIMFRPGSQKSRLKILSGFCRGLLGRLELLIISTLRRLIV